MEPLGRSIVANAPPLAACSSRETPRGEPYGPCAKGEVWPDGRVFPPGVGWLSHLPRPPAAERAAVAAGTRVGRPTCIGPAPGPAPVGHGTGRSRGHAGRRSRWGSACDLRRVPKRGTPVVDAETGTLVGKDKNKDIH